LWKLLLKHPGLQESQVLRFLRVRCPDFLQMRQFPLLPCSLTLPHNRFSPHASAGTSDCAPAHRHLSEGSVPPCLYPVFRPEITFFYKVLRSDRSLFFPQDLLWRTPLPGACKASDNEMVRRTAPLPGRWSDPDRDKPCIPVFLLFLH